MASTELPGVFLDQVTLDLTTETPVLINRDPEPGEVEVPVDTQIALELVDVATDGIDRAATQAFLGGVLAFDGGASPEFQPGFDGPGSGVVETIDTLRITLDPTANFPSLARIEVRVVTQTNAPQPLDTTYDFHIQDLTAPILLEALAISATVVRLRFDESMRQLGDGDPADALRPSNYAFIAETYPAVPVVPVAVTTAGADAMDVTLDIELSQGASYQVTVSNVADRVGNPIGPSGNRAVFTGFIPPNRPATRDFVLINLLPQVNRDRDTTGDLERFLSIVQDVFDLLLADIDRFPDIFDPDRAPERFVDAMLCDLGNPFAFDLTLIQKRRLATLLVELYRQVG
ncbi:MAG: phage tail protein, partial [Proteobacteria bacterium]|nr:phage tail protein [Pseudomonadota bacterium]